MRHNTIGFIHSVKRIFSASHYDERPFINDETRLKLAPSIHENLPSYAIYWTNLFFYESYHMYVILGRVYAFVPVCMEVRCATMILFIAAFIWKWKFDSWFHPVQMFHRSSSQYCIDWLPGQRDERSSCCALKYFQLSLERYRATQNRYSNSLLLVWNSNASKCSKPECGSCLASQFDLKVCVFLCSRKLVLFCSFICVLWSASVAVPTAWRWAERLNNYLGCKSGARKSVDFQRPQVLQASAAFTLQKLFSFGTQNLLYVIIISFS